VGYLTLALLLAGATFKNMHWPGANTLILGSAGFLIIGFVPLYVVNAFQRSGKETIALPYLVMLIVGISVIVLFSNINMRKNLLDIYRMEAMANENRTDELIHKTANLLQMARDTAYADRLPQISEIHEKANRLQIQIDVMQEGMKSFLDQPGIPVEDLKWIDVKGAGREAILEHGNGREFILEAREYKTMLDELIDDPVASNQMEDHLEFAGKVWEHEFGPTQVGESPMIKTYYKNTDASKGIALSEYVAISYLLHH
jgi:hypothetical protein